MTAKTLAASASAPAPEPHAVDTRPPAWQLVLFGLQHVLSMAASPITAVFLLAKLLDLAPGMTVQLVGATFFVCGVGTLIQSLGAGPAGARLPFVMVPGGAPVFLFAAIAAQAGLPAATGAVLATSLFYWLALPFFTRALRFFPRIVVGVMLLLVSINLIKIYAGIVVGQPGAPDFARPQALVITLVTVVATVGVARLFRGTLGRLAVLAGLTAGSLFALATGAMHIDGTFDGPLFTHPVWMPFGMPRFDWVATLPLLVFSVVSMAEAAAQTVAVAEACGKRIDFGRDVPRTIRADALASLLGACFGTSLIVTSAENIGVVQTTGVRSRYVTATAGALLLLLALFVPLARIASAIPAPVVGGTALIVFAMIGVMGVRLLAGVDLDARGNQYTLATALLAGLLPILVPNLYRAFPPVLQVLLGNGMAAGTLTAIAVNAAFQAGRRPRGEQAAFQP
ncbi:uracil-xanthine permease family protein [Paraburkholderia bannensis]|uniref:uracil-xanthine permease family protein n=1 Tax=Paraburkholderia bannensis TaxID=765414 RepID=UPI002AB61748|nr:solute carrier family 23 protein [Paraburkholderia bannensis]